MQLLTKPVLKRQLWVVRHVCKSEWDSSLSSCFWKHWPSYQIPQTLVILKSVCFYCFIYITSSAGSLEASINFKILGVIFLRAHTIEKGSSGERNLCANVLNQFINSLNILSIYQVFQFLTQSLSYYLTQMKEILQRKASKSHFSPMAKSWVM